MDMLNQQQMPFKDSYVCIVTNLSCIQGILGDSKILGGAFICEFQNVT